MPDVLTAREIIQSKFGGRHDVAAITGMKPNVVTQWYAIGIPPRHWMALVQAATEREISGVTFEGLKTIHDSVQRPSKRKVAA